MKFAKELEKDAVPEWRIKYLNYKAGKKYVKAVARAAARANATPRIRADGTPSTFYTVRTDRIDGPARNGNGSGSFLERSVSAGQLDSQSVQGAEPIVIGKRKGGAAHHTGEVEPLQYGSFVVTPPGPSPAALPDGKRKTFALPEPALPTATEPSASEQPNHGAWKGLGRKGTMHRSASAGNASTAANSHQRLLPKSQTISQVSQSPLQLRRLLSYHGGLTPRKTARDSMGISGLDLVQEREAELYRSMDSELEKVESFYSMKEEQAGKRLAVLKEQLYEMRNRRLHELAKSNGAKETEADGSRPPSDGDRTNGWVQPIRAKIFPPGPNSKAMQFMPQTPVIVGAGSGDGSRDYIRRPEDDEVSYRTAKRKLKLALQEFYRGLELLKSYALLNRTAFRKLNKKFDKAVNAKPPYRYVNEKVNKAWFVQSEVLDGHIKVVEDLYSRYFEGGNHKLAVGKLRSLTKKLPVEAGSSFQNGFLVGTGLVFAVQGLIQGIRLLFGEDDELRQQTSYLLQVYGGYFLMLLLFSLFCLNCMIWTRNKINYPFIFEFDQRHHLDWIRLAEFPSFFLLLFGLFIWVTFSRYGPDELYLYFPVILIGITALIIFLPFPILAHRSRRWFVYSHWRLLLAGLYPVEFRDFFLGDIYCSLTYATANIQLFFCLYANHWDNPVQCNSSHSRLMGFLAALPPIWRFLQCLRRYKDTRNVFPHLVNCGKYLMTILAALTLSLYRMNGTHGNLALFITFSVVNSVYCSIWDLFMDFSLLQTDSRHLGLRDILALKSRWPYYSIMVVDPLIRFAWIFYAISTHDTQHSTLVSFLVALIEVVRRGLWAIFRVENEHCANVSQYKASRDVPLPYRIEPLLVRDSLDTSPTAVVEERPQEQQQQQQQQDEEHATPGRAATMPAGQPALAGLSSTTAVASAFSSLRRRTGTFRRWGLSKVLAEAHKQDFEKKRKPPSQPGQAEEGGPGAHDSDDDDDDDDDDEHNDDVFDEANMREANDLRQRGDGAGPSGLI